MEKLIIIVLYLLMIARFIVIAHVVVSLLVHFNVLNYRQPFVKAIYDGLTGLLEPVYRPIRRVLPQTGGLDFAPLITLIAIEVIRILII